MDFHLERGIRLHTEPEYKNLYKWAIVETDGEGKKVGSDQIPWDWTLYFTATSCVLSDDLEISQSFKVKSKATSEEQEATEKESGSEEQAVRQSQAIRIKLCPGDSRRGYDWRRETTFRMFGTERVISHFDLMIYPLTSSSEEEGCAAWGCPSYTAELDFRNETTDDCIVFSLSVRPETFARYVSKVNHGLANEIVVSVGRVDGFYSEWSPEISTRSVKVLTSDSKHEIELPAASSFEPPRLGHLGKLHLYINRNLEFGSPSTSVAADVDPEDTSSDTGKLEPPSRETAVPALADNTILQVLQSIRRAAWFLVWLIALLAIIAMLRR